ncbi:hypothetical protein ATB96_19750 [Elizabethkingia ursingii]|nr:hypothetical protein ATB96_19750 [Elizabethkingia ursingii]
MSVKFTIKDSDVSEDPKFLKYPLLTNYKTELYSVGLLSFVNSTALPCLTFSKISFILYNF